MPSKTKKQANFMAAVANNPKFAKRAGVPQSVGRDFAKADKGKTFQEGGNVDRNSKLKSLRNEIEESRRVADRRPKDAQERMDKSEQLSRINREEKADMNMGGKVKGYKKGGKTSSASSRADGIAVKGHTKGRMV